MSLPDTKTQTTRFLQSLRIVPVKNTHVRKVATSGPGELALEVDLKYTSFTAILRRILGARKTRVFVLEGIGLEVYEYVDGHRTMENLIDIFSARHKLSFFESRALLAQYFQTLVKHGLIVPGLPATH